MIMGKSDRIQRKHELEREQKADKIAAEARSTGRRKILVRTVAAVCIVLVLCVAVWGIGTGSGLFQRSLPAVTINGVDISVAEFNYYYMNVIMQFRNDYPEYIQAVGLNFNLPLSTQNFDEETTWEQYFEEGALDMLKNVVILSEAAKAEGMTLTEADLIAVDSFITGLNDIAEGQPIDRLLPTVFGTGTTLENLRATRERFQLAQRFALEQTKTINVSDEEIDAAYAADPSVYDVVSFNSFNFDYSDEGLDENQLATLKETTLAQANAMVDAVRIGGSFDDLAMQNAPEDQKATYAAADSTLTESARKSVVSQVIPALSDWLFDTARKDGDVTVIEGVNKYVVVRFVSREKESYVTRSVRHIQIVPEVDPAVGVASDEAHVNARAKADELVSELKAAADPVAAFVSLAAVNSEDTATSADGGLMENVQQGVLPEDFNSWLYDAARKEGDIDIVRSDFGYHVVMYVGEGEICWKALVETDLVNKKVDEDYAARSEAATVEYRQPGYSLTK